ncbi:hypothetical protein PMIN03_011450 [Paraphaeosphaeria minitans]
MGHRSLGECFPSYIKLVTHLVSPAATFALHTLQKNTSLSLEELFITLPVMSANKVGSDTVESGAQQRWNFYAIEYNGSSKNTPWSAPDSVELCDGMRWPDGGGWSCFVLLKFKSAEDETVPLAMTWNGITPNVVKPDDRGEYTFVNFWNVYLESCGPALHSVTRFTYGGGVLNQLSVGLK